MRRLCSLFGLLLVLGICCLPVSSFGGDDELVNSIAAAWTEVKPIPLPSGQIADLTMDRAYLLQKLLAKKVLAGGAPAGFKAALTTKAAQEKFGASSALLGPLFKAGRLEPDAVIEVKQYVRPFIETEVGYVISEGISKPVQGVEELKKLVKEVFPAIELPDLRFQEMKGLKAGDIVVDAAGSAKYIEGKRIPAAGFDPNAVRVTLTMDGKTIHEGRGNEALGDQWNALLWLVNEVTKLGWKIEPGQVFITGALGGMAPGKPGKYEADFGSLGKLSFAVK
ncbi:MAG: hypothetical protein V2B18_01105 [Pseudomonadota bacterium]